MSLEAFGFAGAAAAFAGAGAFGAGRAFAPLEAIFDASQVTGTRTGLAGEYRAYASWAEQQHAAQLPSLQRLFAAQPTAEPG